MKENNTASTEWIEIGREGSNSEGSDSPFMFVFVTYQNIHTGKLRVDVQIPNAGVLRFPEDLGVLLRSFGWGMASLGMTLRNSPPQTWHDCCEVLDEVDALFKVVV